MKRLRFLALASRTVLLCLLCAFTAMAASASRYKSRFHFEVEMPAPWSVTTEVGSYGEWRERFFLDDLNGVELYETNEKPYTRKSILEECGPPPKFKTFDPARCTHATRNGVLYLEMEYGMIGSHTWSAFVPGVRGGRLAIAAISRGEKANDPVVRAMYERLVEAATKQAAPRREIAP